MDNENAPMQNILFIVPPNLTFDDYVNPPSASRQVIKADGRCYGNLATDMPLGILSMSAYLKKHARIHTELIDFNVELNKTSGFAFASYFEYFHQFLSQRSIECPPDIIGISSLFTPSFFSLIEIASCCKERYPNSVIIGGGSVPSNMYPDIFENCDVFDALCYGEGEKPLLALIEATDKQQALKQGPAWITREKLEAGKEFQHQFIENLDEIPFYDYDICDLAQYGINPAMTAYAAVKEKSSNHFQVMTSRGCPFKCTFCASHKVHGRTMRYYSQERVHADFLRLRDRYGADTLVFQDDHFMGDKQRALDIVNQVRDLGLTAVFQNGLALYALDRQMLETLKQAGVNHLVLAVESGSERVLHEIMHKPLKLAIVQRVAHDCRELGIYASVNILIGMPGETKQDIEDAREFLKTIDANWFIILCASPLVGSEMYTICEDKGYLKNNYLGADYRRAVVETEDFTSAYIQETLYDLNIELNFVRNADVRLGLYSVALQGFENAIRAKSDHAIAWYFAAQCLEKLGDVDKSRQYLEQTACVLRESHFWRSYFEKFNLPIQGLM
jgi:anaerobic magnesium-protoporphyrin IX monomethyl ester cyclase